MGRVAVAGAFLFATLLVIPVAVSPAWADHVDGMTLMVSTGTGPGSVQLDWTGGQPTFRVYRSTQKSLIVDPSTQIGTSDVRAFTDTPPAGSAFFYEIASPCVLNPPEICNGLDDDCDGTIDGPGAEASCSLPNATAACSNGACIVAACNGGFGDCDTNPADGCEAPLGVAQSNSPASIWANDPNPNQDLKPGFLRVAAITNCGGCGVTCDDGIPCTTDLCVPAGGAPVCRHFDRGQCATARCGGLALPPGTPLPGDPGCTAPDTDNDGLTNAWESAQTDPYTGLMEPIGVDIDCDGEISDPDGDFVYPDPPAGPGIKDAYVAYDYMAASSAPGDEESASHQPPQEAIDAVVAAFAARSVVLHVDPVHHELPHAAVVYFPEFPPGPCATGDAVSFYDLKAGHFDERRKYAYRYFVFGHNVCASGSAASDMTGISELRGNDGIVSLGSATYSGTTLQVGRLKTAEYAGTFMHELGHTLGLDHGGPGDSCSPKPCGSALYTKKPNYISSMSYMLQLGGITRAASPGTIFPFDALAPWRVDYSHGARLPLDESNLSENDGLGVAPSPYDRDIARYDCPGPVASYAPGYGPVDWNCDTIYGTGVAADIDGDGSQALLPGADDWDNLDYRFQCQPTFANGVVPPDYVASQELSVAAANALGVRARVQCDPGVPFECFDADFCNGFEVCSPSTGYCEPGTPPSCDDGNPCTDDSCSEGTGCVHVIARDGTVCSLPNAEGICSIGACVIYTCNGGFGDCDTNPANGCEVALVARQSNSPSALWAGDPNPDQDLQPGFVRVPVISNCGACGQTCDDGNSCTTDVCVQIVGSQTLTATCRHYDRGQCAEARCGGLTLPPGTPAPRDPACTAPDTDGDGLSNSWETSQTNPYTSASQPVGIDLDCDGEISDPDGDFVYSDPPLGPDIKDVYLEVAYMAQSPVPGVDPESHAPAPGVLDAAVAAFGQAGIALHVDPLISEVPHSDFVKFTSSASCGIADTAQFQSIKNGVFDPKKKYTHHYVLFSHDVCVDTAATDGSGGAEIGGNDFSVSLGSFDYAGTTVGVDTKMREQAGTLLHELGHNLGLTHHGPATTQPCEPNCPPEQVQKSNYISVMSYSHQLFGITRAATPGTIGPPDPTVPWRVDFSHGALGTLDEQNLNEAAGLSGASAPYDRDIARIYCPGQGDPLGLTFENGAGGIDFDCNGTLSPGAIADIDHDGILATLPGADDWHGLDYRFQCQPSFADGPDSPTWVTPQELTAAIAQSRGLRAYVPCQADLDCDDGLFCNGVETCDVTTGLCRPGTPPSCDDGNSCTTDACSSATDACIHPSAPDGLPCGGSLFCVVGQTCQSGVCGGGAPRDCEDGIVCTANACSEAQHACIVTGCTTAPCWSAPLGSGVATAPVSDAALLPAGTPPTTTFIGKGTTLYALRNAADATGPAGSVRWTWNTPGNTINNFPAPVPLSNGTGEYLYVTTGDGFLHKIRASDGAVAGQADARRVSCPTDQVSASPAVQLYRFSNATFQNEMDSHAGHGQDDLIIVITRNQCSDSTRNRVIAYYASDLTIKWMFNSAGTFKMDYGSDACSVDYASNRLYCGTNLNPGQTSQNSLWAIDSTGASAQPIWSANAGSIQNRPILHGGRLYVANADGTVMAYDPAGNAATGGAAALWTSPVVLSSPVVRAPAVESRGGAWVNRILALDTAGVVHRITDQGTRGNRDWSIVPAGGTGLKFVSIPVVDSLPGKAYVGRNDGKVQQVELSTGASEVQIVLGPPNLVFDPSLDLSNGTTASGRLTVATGVATGSVSQFCAPPPYGICLSDADCTAWSGACVTGACDPLEHVCYARPNPDDSACSDGRACSSGDACKVGICEPADVSTCACVSAGDAACATGLTCCGGGVCANLQTDSAHCGSCSNACAADRTCSGGACVAAPAACLAPTAATLSSVASLLGGGDGLAFDRPAGAAGTVCSAYLSTYRYPSASVVSKVDPSGAVQTMTSPSTDSAPLGAIATPREGNQLFVTALNRAPGLFPTTQSALIEGAFSPAHLTVARTTLSTSATVPFTSTIYDQGPVGPAFDYQTYTGAGGDSRLYFGNWATNGDVVELRRPCPVCTWTQTTVPVSILPAGDRITAIAFEQHKSPDLTQNHRSLYIGHGTTLSIVDLDTGSQKNVDLSATSPPLQNTAILGIAVHPVYGDLYVEVKDSSGARKLLDIDEHDLSVRLVRDVQIDLHLQPLVPLGFSSDGRLAITPDFKLLRLVTPALIGGPPGFAGYQVAR